MTEPLLRTFTAEVDVRGSGDGQTLSGIAVPYGRPQVIDPHLTEQFARGAFKAQMRAAMRIPVTRDHMAHGGQLIGRVAGLRDDAAGLWFEARVSRTVAGSDTLELLRDGALDQVSIGFLPRQNRTLVDGVVERVTAELRELAVVAEGAYGAGAVVESVRAVSRTIHLDMARGVLLALPAVLPL